MDLKNWISMKLTSLNAHWGLRKKLVSDLKTVSKISDEKSLPRPLHTADGTTYILENEIGRGGLGVVYEAHLPGSKQVFALKMTLDAHNELAHELFQNEIQTLKALSHPHIPNMVDFGKTTSGELYVVMENIQGITLSKLIQKEKRLSRERAIDICLQIANALVHAHENGYVHRDIKPSNIMISNRSGLDWAYLIDFGISSLEGDMNKPAIAEAGSLYYQSPEQIFSGEFTKQTDIYQLALVLVECLFGELPFEMNFADAISYRKSGDLLPKNIDLNPELTHVLEKALSREMKERPSNMKVFSTMIRTVPTR